MSRSVFPVTVTSLAVPGTSIPYQPQPSMLLLAMQPWVELGMVTGRLDPLNVLLVTVKSAQRSNSTQALASRPSTPGEHGHASATFSLL